ncbi:MAG: peptidoglycan editing factor PgeF [Pseudomonadota bacterium]
MTTRHGGLSAAPFDSFNLGIYVGDPAASANRARLRDLAGLPAEPVWLHQVHGTRCVNAGDTVAETDADASWTADDRVVLAALAADCLPVLFASQGGDCVAAAHAGWRGLAAGVLERTLNSMPVDTDGVIAWLGPAIGPNAFEVGSEVREVFCDAMPADAAHFRPGERPERWFADLAGLARARLVRAGVAQVSGGDRCTVAEPEHFFSHRRDRGETGRMAALIWLD